MEPRFIAVLSPVAARGGSSLPLRWRREGSKGRVLRRGFTLVEVVLTLVIVAILTSLGFVSYQAYRARVDVAKAGSDIAVISASVTEFKNEWGRFPNDLAEIGRTTMVDPWGQGYQYLSHADPASRGLWRKDKNIVPINSDFDLYSMGKDGATAAPLTAAPSRDDIIRANDGAFIGLGSTYDP